MGKTIKMTIAKITAIAVILLLPIFVWAQAATWPVGQGGNGHYYEVIKAPSEMSWDIANSNAAARGGYLATCSTSNENAFVYGIARQNTNAWYVSPASGYWYGPCIGGFQPSGSAEPDGNWRWVTGEALIYKNWLAGQPNNSGGTENCLQFCGATLAKAATWNDLNSINTTYVRGFIVEYDTLPRVMIKISEDVEILWPSRTNTLYTVQYSSTLSSNAWVDLITHIEGNGVTNLVVDSAAIGKTQSFYRVKIE